MHPRTYDQALYTVIRNQKVRPAADDLDRDRLAHCECDIRPQRFKIARLAVPVRRPANFEEVCAARLTCRLGLCATITALLRSGA